MEVAVEKINSIKKKYNEFTNSSCYEERKIQLEYANFAKPLIEKVVQKDSITNEDLTALIQIFGHGSRHDNVKKYIDSLGLDDSFSKAIFNKFAEIGQTGFTGKGKHKIQNLTDEQLKIVHKFLKNISYSNSKDQIRGIVSEFEKSAVPLITCGIYSPWLYYLHPTICPIVVGPVKQYLKNIGWDQKSYLDAWGLLEQINQAINEENYGFLDSFIYESSNENGYWLFIVPKNYEEGKLWNYCKENSIAAMQYQKGSEPNNLVTRNINQIKKIQFKDRVIVYLNDNIIGGIGEVSNEFYQDTTKNNGFDGHFGQRIGLKWLTDHFEVDFKGVKPFLKKFPKALHLITIHEIDGEDFEKIFKFVSDGIIDESKPSSEINLLHKKKQIILYGPPGTGKTHSTRKIAISIITQK